MKKIGLIALTFVFTFLLASCIESVPEMYWAGTGSTTIYVGDYTTTCGPVSAIDEDGNTYTDDITTKTNGSRDEPGEYRVAYTVDKEHVTGAEEDYGASCIYTVINAINGHQNQTVLYGETIDLLEGVTARDLSYNDLTENIEVSTDLDTEVPGDYTVTYSVDTGDGGIKTASIIVTVVSDFSPELDGLEDQTIIVGDTIDLSEGVTASDLEDGDLTADIVVDGTVYNNVAGDYIITYTVTDSDDNETSETITVTVRTDTDPVITGADDFNVYQGSTLLELAAAISVGVAATDAEDGVLTNDIVVDGPSDISELGDYTVTYSITDSDDNTASISVTMTVIEDNPPTLSGMIDITIYQGETYDLTDGITAIDDKDGDITSSIVITESIDVDTAGLYTVNYAITDSSGNEVTEEVTLTVLEDAAPVITGFADFSIDVGDTYDLETGVTVSDVVDGDLTTSLTIDDTVDNMAPGTYVVTYSVTDSYGNLTEETITVTVNALTSPYSGDVVSAAATEPYVIGVAFDVDMFDNSVLDTTAFTFVVDGFTASITDYTIGVDSILFTIDEIISLGSTVTMDYAKTGTSDLTYGGFIVPDFTNQAVDTSSIGSGGSSYSGEVMMAAAFDANTIDIVFDVDTLDNSVLDLSAFTVLIDDVATTITSSSINFDTVTLVITGTMDDFTFVEVSYNPTGTNDLTYGGVNIPAFQDEPVTPPMGGGPMF
jgi:hypothetical protein